MSVVWKSQTHKTSTRFRPFCVCPSCNGKNLLVCAQPPQSVESQTLQAGRKMLFAEQRQDMNAVRQMTLSLIRKRYFAEQWHALPVASHTLQAGRKMLFAEPLQDHKTTTHCVESQTLQSKGKTTTWRYTILRPHVRWQWLCPILQL